MTGVHRQSITDTRLLEYMYTTIVEGLRKSQKSGMTMASAGMATLICWQTAAKSMQSKNDRMALWDTLFSTAMHEDCWEDARHVSKYLQS
jgi:N-terminal acetyltransferase B complex non-catalytic subunit